MGVWLNKNVPDGVSLCPLADAVGGEDRQQFNLQRDAADSVNQLKRTLEIERINHVLSV